MAIRKIAKRGVSRGTCLTNPNIYEDKNLPWLSSAVLLHLTYPYTRKNAVTHGK
jgi:hypothetical protein